MCDKELMQLAAKAREKAYCPYSHFAVGAALLTKSGKVYLGCNVENAAFGATNCAERTAVFSAVADGEREWEALAVVGGREGSFTKMTAPCGVCRQVLSEFCTGDFRLILGTPDVFSVCLLKDLLPLSFGGADLEK